MARVGDGVAKIAPAGVVGNLADGRLAQRRRPRLLEVAVHQLDDPQQLVADPRVLAGQQPRQLLRGGDAARPSDGTPAE